MSQCMNLTETLVMLLNNLRGHNLHANADKTQAIIIGTRKYLNMLDKVKNIIVNGETVKYCSNVKNLGVIFDETLSWKEHLQ